MKHTEKGMSGSAFWSQGGSLKGVARELLWEEGQRFPQRREEEGQRGSGHPTRESGAQLLEIATGLLKTGMSYSKF